MKHPKIFAILLILLSVCQISYATMISTAATPSSFWKGALVACPQCESGLRCDNTQMSNLCSYFLGTSPGPGSISVDYEDISGYGTLRIIFNQSWGSGIAIAGAPISLPPFVLSYYGVASLRIQPGTYSVAPPNAMYPFGYVDVVTGP
jgi:hypothetical protein